MNANEILKKHEDANEMHFHEVDRKWIIQAMEEYAVLRQPAVMRSLPDDEEIEKKAHEWLKANYGKYKPSEWRAFIESATWMRELSKCNDA